MTNLLADTEGRLTFQQYTVSDFWTGSVDGDGFATLTATVETLKGVPYSLEFAMAANLAAGVSDVAIEVSFAGEAIGTFTHSGALYGEQAIDLVGTGTAETLTFRIVDAGAPDAGQPIDTSGVIPSYGKAVVLGGETVTVDAFAPGQSNLYQVLHGQLVKFDLETATYTEAEFKNDLPLNAIGLNVEDDLVYGLATSSGRDSRGVALSAGDLVAIDARGATYRVGETPYNTFIGDFDGEGNLWVFGGNLSYAAVIDVDRTGPDGNPATVHYDLATKLPGGLNGLADLAYDEATRTFYGVAREAKAGDGGALVAVDVSTIARGGTPEITVTTLAGTLVDAELRGDIPSTAYGAAMVDADGNVYVGANSGDHDIDRTTPDTGGLYRVTRTESGELALELLSAAPSVRINDGAMDTRGFDPFLGIDTSSTVLLRAPELTIAIAEDDVVAVTANGAAVTVDLLANDTVSDGGTLKVVSIAGVAFEAGRTVTLAGGETIAMNADFTVDVRAPARTASGTVEVAYGIEDQNGVADTGILTIAVSPVDGTAGNDSMGRGYVDADGNVIDGADGPHDVVMGYAGNDKIFVFDGDDFVDGGTGNDFMRGYAGDDTLLGGDGNDVLDGGTGIDRTEGGAGDDTYFVDHAGDAIVDTAGIDTVKSHVSLTLADGLEHLWLLGRAAVAGGNAADNTLVGNALANTLAGHGGDDQLLSGAGDDMATGGAGNDRIDGEEGDDDLAGEDGNDKILGGDGVDTIDGGAGDDTLAAGPGGSAGSRETIVGGRGDDILHADTGAAAVVFRAGDGHDVMKGFKSGVDILVLEGVGPEAVSIETRGGSTTIEYGAGDTIRLSLGFADMGDLVFV